ncbi:MAG: hypothetical protein P8P91_18660, partial [Pseudomonadales bacterium]|nr:hypothetical protein [Pseudomonadales bacterium]
AYAVRILDDMQVFSQAQIGFEEHEKLFRLDWECPNNKTKPREKPSLLLKMSHAYEGIPAEFSLLWGIIHARRKTREWLSLC